MLNSEPCTCWISTLPWNIALIPYPHFKWRNRGTHSPYNYREKQFWNTLICYRTQKTSANMSLLAIQASLGGKKLNNMELGKVKKKIPVEMDWIWGFSIFHISKMHVCMHVSACIWVHHAHSCSFAARAKKQTAEQQWAHPVSRSWFVKPFLPVLANFGCQ